MKLDKNKLRSVIRESINQGLSRGNLSNADKIKEQLKSFNRSFIISSYELCELVPELDFQRIVRELVSEMIEDTYIADSIHGTVSNMLEILHADKTQTFYIEDENAESDVQMEFAFKTVNDIMQNLEDYYVNYFIAIGKGL